MKKPRYIRIRTDFWTHPKTCDLRAIERVLFEYAASRNFAGVLMEPLALIAAANKESQEDCARALDVLVAKGLLRAYPEIGAYWNIEAADENLDGRVWPTVRTDVASLPPAIARDFRERYRVELRLEQAELFADSCPSISSTSSPTTVPEVVDELPVSVHVPVSVSVHVSDPADDRQISCAREAEPRPPDPKPPDAGRPNASAWAAEFAWTLRGTSAHGVVLQSPFAAQQAPEGIARALSEYGPELVGRVVLWTQEQAALHRTSGGKRGVCPSFFGRMFVGDGFAARLDAYEQHLASEARIAAAEAERERDSPKVTGPPVPLTPEMSVRIQAGSECLGRSARAELERMAGVQAGGP